jgi:hypothetical protein
MSKRTTKNGITTIKCRGVTIKVDDRELAKIDAEEAPQRAAAAEHSRVFGLLDAVSQAKTDLEGTVHVMSLLLETDRHDGDGVPDTIERWIKADMAALDRAFDTAWEGIVRRQPRESEAEAG